jgi:hypothetical protein
MGRLCNLSECSCVLTFILGLTLLPASLNGPHMTSSRVALVSICGVNDFTLRIPLGGPVAAEVNIDGFTWRCSTRV